MADGPGQSSPSGQKPGLPSCRNSLTETPEGYRTGTSAPASAAQENPQSAIRTRSSPLLESQSGSAFNRSVRIMADRLRRPWPGETGGHLIAVSRGFMKPGAEESSDVVKSSCLTASVIPSIIVTTSDVSHSVKSHGDIRMPTRRSRGLYRRQRNCTDCAQSHRAYFGRHSVMCFIRLSIETPGSHIVDFGSVAFGGMGGLLTTSPDPMWTDRTISTSTTFTSNE
ncbi:hypothetical protein BKA07_002140 [Brevibacterium marinum]|uniref:Uncharacterized protein n=1 Tax=Brevibacterium marinum TaxID=418643 RepID=A0A846S0A3_9MICO|nr:hypothetical protein [Brevibacterium marinum]